MNRSPFREDIPWPSKREGIKRECAQSIGSKRGIARHVVRTSRANRAAEVSGPPTTLSVNREAEATLFFDATPGSG
jgi:hypothetical protein